MDRRIKEIKGINTFQARNNYDLQGKIENFQEEECYEKLFLEKCTLRVTHAGDNCAYMKCGSIIIISRFSRHGGKICIIGKKLKILRPLTNYPADYFFVTLRSGVTE